MSRISFIGISRGIIFCGSKVLLCRAKGYDFWFLPGGGIEENENAETTLRRELMEENALLLEKVEYLVTLQNRFLEKGIFVNEIDLVFTASIPEGTQVKSLEDHMESGLFTRNEITTMTILPPTLKHALMDVMDGKPIPTFIGLDK